MKRLLAFLACLLVLILIINLFLTSWYSPRRQLEKMLTALQKGSIAKAERCTQEGTLNINLKNRNTKRFYKNMFSSISYSVNTVSVDGYTARINVTITMYDMAALLSNTSLDSLNRAFSSWGSGTSYYKLINDRMKTNTVSYEHYTVNVHLVKTGGKWRVSMSDSPYFALAITGGVSGLIGY